MPRELFDDPDRESIPGALPVVSVHEDDEPSTLAEIEERAQATLELTRRGHWHGEWAVLEPDDEEEDLDTGRLTARWRDARPIVLPGILDDVVEELGDELDRAEADHEVLSEAGGLRTWLSARAEALEPHFRLAGRDLSHADPERDLQRCGLTFVAHPERASSKTVRDLWLKTGWLSTHEDDASLRMRFSFGREVDDDASADALRHGLVTRLAEACLPETVALHEHPDVSAILATLCGEPITFSQHIAYWNAPEGGALFHHDAFGDPDVSGQRGVLFAQLTGHTAWLALSIEDLATRVTEFLEAMRDGELHWVRSQVFGDEFPRALELASDHERLISELGLPGCGFLGRLCDRGPEFTSFLADAGHALVLSPGDALLLPNHGTRRTAMHSVFCAGGRTGYALSLAIRSKVGEEPGGNSRGRSRFRTDRGSR